MIKKEKQQATADKYYNKLKVLLKAVSSSTFIAGRFLNEHGLNKKFIYACEDIGYIQQTGKQGLRIIYKANYIPEQVKPETGEIIRKNINELTRRERVKTATKAAKRNSVLQKDIENSSVKVNKEEEEIGLRKEVRKFIEQKFAEVGYVKEPVKEMKLSEIRSEDLIGELQKREYEGTLTQITTMEGVTVLKTIEINIKKKEN